MADGVNEVRLLGNVGNEPTYRVVGDTPMIRIRVATPERYKDTRTGEWQERAEWHTVVQWGRPAEALSKVLVKGARIYVEGKISTRKSEKEGQVVHYTNVTAKRIVLLGGNRRAEPAPDGAPRPDEYGDSDGYDDEIPF